MDLVTAFAENWSAWLSAVTGVVTAATAVTALTPTKADGRFLRGLLRVLNVLAGNVAKNRNADDVD